MTCPMPTGAQFNEASLPPSISRKVVASLDGASQAWRTIGGTFRRPVVAGELAHHERVLRPYRTMVTCDRRQSFPYSSASRTPREGYEPGFRVSFVFRSDGHAGFCNSKKPCDSLPVGQEPRFHAPNRDPKAHSGNWIGKVPLKAGGCTFIPVEITQCKPKENGARLG